MGLWAAVKERLGIGVVTVTLEVPELVPRGAGKVEGTLRLTGKRNQRVKQVTVTLEMIRSWDEISTRPSTGGGESYPSRQSHRCTLGQFRRRAPFAITSGEVKAIPFTIAFKPAESGPEADALSKMSSAIDNELYDYRLEAKAVLEGIWLSPSDSKTVIVL